MRTPNNKCAICNKDIYVRPSALAKSKGWGFTCSKECGKINRANNTKGELNHQSGLKGELNSSFKGYEKVSRYGYKLIYKPLHKRANHAGYVFEHILVMEKHIKRPLIYFGFKNKNNEVCHHIDRDKLNNNINNLELMTDSEHAKLHIREDRSRSLKAGITRSIVSKVEQKVIIDLYKKGGITQKQLASKFGFSQSLINNVINKGRYCYGKQ